MFRFWGVWFGDKAFGHRRLAIVLGPLGSLVPLLWAARHCGGQVSFLFPHLYSDHKLTMVVISNKDPGWWADGTGDSVVKDAIINSKRPSRSSKEASVRCFSGNPLAQGWRLQSNKQRNQKQSALRRTARETTTGCFSWHKSRRDTDTLERDDAK